MVGEETQLLADGCVALLQSVFGESNWFRWNGVKEQAQMENNTQGFIAWLLDLAEQDMKRASVTEDYDDTDIDSAQYQNPSGSGGDVSDGAYEKNQDHLELFQTSHSAESDDVVNDNETVTGVKREQEYFAAAEQANFLEQQPLGDIITIKPSTSTSTSTGEIPADAPFVQITYNNVVKSFSCDNCGVAISDVEVVREHLHLRHGGCNLSLCCCCCSQEFRHVQDFVSYHIESAAAVGKSKGNSVCSYCAKSFSGKQFLDDHIASKHHKVGPRYECPKCLKKFNYASSLKRHTKTCSH